MKMKFMVIMILVFSVFLQAEEFKTFSQFQKHINQESKRVIDKDMHAAIRAERDLRDYNVGDFRDFWRFDFTDMPPIWEQAQATCRAVGEHCYIFVSDEEWNVNIDQEDIEIILNYLENTTMNEDDFGAIQMDIDLFGPIPDELDNDEKIIVYYSALGSFNGTMFDGYFSSYNQVTESEAATMNPPGYSNECEMIYMTCSPLNPTEPIRISVLSHELQHMIHWEGDENESTWVDEGMAELAMVHFGMPDPITTFNGNANYSLNMWDQQWKDYVKVLLFFTYLDEQVTTDGFIADVVAEQLNGIAGIQAQLTASGYDLTFEEIFRNWTIANYLDEEDIYDGLYNYSALDLPVFSYSSYINSFPDDESASVEPWATRYVRIFNDNPLSLDLNVGHDLDVALLTLGTGVDTIVEIIEVSENGVIEIPALVEAYNSNILVLPNANDSVLNYSFEVVELLSADEELPNVENSFNLSNYPNPFNPSRAGHSPSAAGRCPTTTISFSLDSGSNRKFKLAIFNSKGQEIRTFDLASSETNSVVWNGKDNDNVAVSSGIYFCKLKSGSKSEIIKIMLMK